MKCKEIQSNLARLIFDDFEDDKLRQQVRGHLDSCTACRKKYQEMRQTLTLLHDGLAAEPQPQLDEARREKVYLRARGHAAPADAPRSETQSESAVSAVPWKFVFRIAAVMVVVLAGVAAVWSVLTSVNLNESSRTLAQRPHREEAEAEADRSETEEDAYLDFGDLDLPRPAPEPAGRELGSRPGFDSAEDRRATKQSERTEAPKLEETLLAETASGSLDRAEISEEPQAKAAAPLREDAAPESLALNIPSARKPAVAGEPQPARATVAVREARDVAQQPLESDEQRKINTPTDLRLSRTQEVKEVTSPPATAAPALPEADAEDEMKRFGFAQSSKLMDEPSRDYDESAAATGIDRISAVQPTAADTSFQVVQALLAQGVLPPPQTVRTEEFVNAFDYGYSSTDAPSIIHARMGPHPFRRGKILLQIGVRPGAVAESRRVRQPLADLEKSRRGTAAIMEDADDNGQMSLPTGNVSGGIMLQVEFSQVQEYKLVGYDSRQTAALTESESEVDTAGAKRKRTVGPQSANVLYEIVPVDDGEQNETDTLAIAHYRYWNPETGVMENYSERLSARVIEKATLAETPGFYLAACAAQLAELLKLGDDATDSGFEQIEKMLREVAEKRPDDNRAAVLLQLTRRVQELRKERSSEL